MDCGEEISGGFVVASGDGAVLLELAEEILDEVACLIGVFVEIALNLAVALGRDHERLFPCKQRLDHPFFADAHARSCCSSGILIMRIARQHLKQLLPHLTLGPAREARMCLIESLKR